jgi:hypothetical protein
MPRPAYVESEILPSSLEFFGHFFFPIGQNSSLAVPGHLFLLFLSPQSLSATPATYLYRSLHVITPSFHSWRKLSLNRAARGR